MFITKFVISFTILSIVGHCTGTVFIEDANVIDHHKKSINYDLFLFRQFNVQSLGLHLQQCLLANMIYIQKGYFASTIGSTQKSNVKKVLDNVLRIFRSSTGQKFLTHIDAEKNLVPVYIQIKKWISESTMTNVLHMQQLATNVIDTGIKGGIWYTEKGQELLDAYRYSKNDIITTAMDQCTNSLLLLGKESREIEMDHLLDLYNQANNFYGPLDGRLVNVNQGFIGFLMSSEEYNKIFIVGEEHNDVKFYGVLDIVTSTLENIFDGLLNILYTRNIFMCDYVGKVELPDQPRIQVEILLLLQDIFPSVVELAQHVFLLYQTKDLEGTSIIFEFDVYMIFSEKFRLKWIYLIKEIEKLRTIATLMASRDDNNDENKTGQNASSGENQTSQNASSDENQTGQNASSDENQTGQNANADGVTVIESVNTQPMVTEKEDFDFNFYDNVNDNPGNEHPLPENGRLIKNGTIFPSLMAFYGIFNKSWNDRVQNEKNTNQNKVFLFEIKAWVVLLQHTISFYPAEISSKFPEEGIIPNKILDSKIWNQFIQDSKFMSYYK